MLQLLQLQPNIVEINRDNDSDIGNIVSITSTADLQVKNNLYDSKEEVDFFMDPFVDRPDSPIDESVYTASEIPEIPQKPLGRRHRTRQLFIAACKNLEQSGNIYRSALYYKTR